MNRRSDTVFGKIPPSAANGKRKNSPSVQGKTKSTRPIRAETNADSISIRTKHHKRIIIKDQYSIASEEEQHPLERNSVPVRPRLKTLDRKRSAKVERNIYQGQLLVEQKRSLSSKRMGSSRSGSKKLKIKNSEEKEKKIMFRYIKMKQKQKKDNDNVKNLQEKVKECKERYGNTLNHIKQINDKICYQNQKHAFEMRIYQEKIKMLEAKIKIKDNFTTQSKNEELESEAGGSTQMGLPEQSNISSNSK